MPEFNSLGSYCALVRYASKCPICIIHTHAHAHAHTHTHIRTHAHTHAHTQAHAHTQNCHLPDPPPEARGPHPWLQLCLEETRAHSQIGLAYCCCCCCCVAAPGRLCGHETLTSGCEGKACIHVFSNLLYTPLNALMAYVNVKPDTRQT